MIKKVIQGVVLAAFIVFLPALLQPAAFREPKMWCLWLLGVLANTFQPGYRPIDPDAPRADQNTATQIVWTVYLTQLAIILEALFLRFPASMVFTPVAWVSLAVMVFGLYLRTHAVLVLGQYFTWHVHVEQAQPVIQTGPYRFIRHPGYAGAWLTYAGTAVFLTAWYSLAPTVIFLTLAFVRRIRLEEATLERTLGPAYVEYGKRTARLCPGIW